MSDSFEVIAALGIVPVIAIEDARHAVPLADALLAGGITAAEITFRTKAAADVLAILASERPQLTIGAGTVLDRAALEAAQKAGARFGLAPGFDDDVVAAAQAAQFPFAPGVMTPSEVSRAIGKGLRLAKFFPAGVAGGPAALEAIAAPFAHLGVRFIPTGGVSLENMGDWLRLKSVAAVGGTWIARTDDIRENRFADITRKARAAVERAQSIREAR